MAKRRLFTVGLVVLLAGSGRAPGTAPVGPDHDLDTYTDAQLTADLDAELDDIEVGDGGTLQPDGEYPLDELRGDILEALSDDGDDADESDVDYADLEDEASEAGTTLEDVVDAALARADQLAAAGSPSVRYHYAGFSLAAQSRNQKGFTKTSVAIHETVVLTIATIRRAPRKS
jgi:hypothetical protein